MKSAHVLLMIALSAMMKAQFNIKGGVAVYEVSGNPAIAGLKAGDIIIEMKGTAINSLDGLNAIWSNLGNIAGLEVKIIRGGKGETLSIVPPKGNAPAPPPAPASGEGKG